MLELLAKATCPEYREKYEVTVVGGGPVTFTVITGVPQPESGDTNTVAGSRSDRFEKWLRPFTSTNGKAGVEKRKERIYEMGTTVGLGRIGSVGRSQSTVSM
jgi:hypothetical protein